MNSYYLLYLYPQIVNVSNFKIQIMLIKVQ